ncbi:MULTISPECIES: abortive infection family protein [Burkholderia]|uniref:abortive infection family protein n=1 Tax=Burkholderia TaxID=32008 RepID=UPI0011ABE38E|nr:MULTISPECIES: abortive infection family protein [Burkholderia cepacia complex]MDN7893334.1 abortive infection family protein [Burkholderia cepacia]
MRDRIEALAAHRQRFEVKRRELIARAGSLHGQLKEAIGEGELYVSTATITLDDLGDGESVYGNLACYPQGFSICTRTTYDDSQDTYRRDGGGGGFRLESLDDVKFEYLDLLLTDESLGTLFERIERKFAAREARLDTSLARLQAMLESESAKLDEQLVGTLNELGSVPLQDSWSATIAALHMNPADGLTRSSSFVEAVCEDILRQRGVELPPKQAMKQLIETVIANLEWPDDAQLQEDMKRVMSGVSTLCQGIGALRTHYGSAHGSSAHQPPLDPEFATLAKNAAAAVAIFLLVRHRRPGAPSREAGA